MVRVEVDARGRWHGLLLTPGNRRSPSASSPAGRAIDGDFLREQSAERPNAGADICSEHRPIGSLHGEADGLPKPLSPMSMPAT